MRCLVDANLPTDVSRVLSAAGHDVRDVRYAQPPLSDDVVYTLAKAERRTIFTRDLDFSNLLRYPPRGTAGIIVLRVSDMTAAEITTLVADFIGKHTPTELQDALIILEPFRVRFRREI